MATIIDFEDEDLPVNTIVVDQYQPQGVIVNGAEIRENPPGNKVAYSGKRYLRSGVPTSGAPPSVTFTFPNHAKSVSLYAGLETTVPVAVTLQAFNFKHEVVAHDPDPATPWRFVTDNTCHERFSVSTASFDISFVTLYAATIVEGKIFWPFEVVDHLEFEPGPSVSVPVDEQGLYGHILAGIRAGEGGVIWGPHGPIHVPPIGPGQRAILAAFVANGVAEMIGDVGSRRAIQRAALGVIAREANRLAEGL